MTKLYHDDTNKKFAPFIPNLKYSNKALSSNFMEFIRMSRLNTFRKTAKYFSLKSYFGEHASSIRYLFSQQSGKALNDQESRLLEQTA